MQSFFFGGFLYALWLLLPVILIRLLYKRRVRPWLFRILSLVLLLLACPAYLMLLLLLPGWVWPPDILLPSAPLRVEVSLPTHQVAYVQIWGNDFYTTYFEVTRADGAIGYLEIDGDDHKCWNILTHTVGTKIYFLCGAEPITTRTSYVDTAHNIVYAGFVECGRHLNALSYRTDGVNPLTDSQWIGEEYLCFDNIPGHTTP